MAGKKGQRRPYRRRTTSTKIYTAQPRLDREEKAAVRAAERNDTFEAKVLGRWHGIAFNINVTTGNGSDEDIREARLDEPARHLALARALKLPAGVVDGVVGDGVATQWKASVGVYTKEFERMVMRGQLSFTDPLFGCLQEMATNGVLVSFFLERADQDTAAAMLAHLTDLGGSVDDLGEAVGLASEATGALSAFVL